MLKYPPTNPMPEPKNAALRLNMKAVLGPETPFLAVSAYQHGFGGFRTLGDSLSVFAKKKKPSGGRFSPAVDLPSFNIHHSRISPAPPF